MLLYLKDHAGTFAAPSRALILRPGMQSEISDNIFLLTRKDAVGVKNFMMAPELYCSAVVQVLSYPAIQETPVDNKTEKCERLSVSDIF